MPVPNIALCSSLNVAVQETKCFNCLSKFEKRALIVWFLEQSLIAVGGTDYSNFSDLRNAIKCLDCAPPSQIDSFEVGLYQQLAILSGADVAELSIAQLRDKIKCMCDPALFQTLRVAALYLLCVITNQEIQPPVPCWVAREVYGNTNPKWIIFALWLNSQAPRWLHSLYLSQGQRFARWIADKPRIKCLVQYFMDKVVNR